MTPWPIKMLYLIQQSLQTTVKNQHTKYIYINVYCVDLLKTLHKPNTLGYNSRPHKTNSYNFRFEEVFVQLCANKHWTSK